MKSEPFSVSKKRVLSSLGDKGDNVKATKMTTSVRFTSIVRRGDADSLGLEPAPSITDWVEIAEGLKGLDPVDLDTLLKGTHKISGSYRGWTMWLYPNVRFYRNEPTSSGINGYAGFPILGTKEAVTLRMDDQVYDAEVEFV